jgi:hypothetical protein
MVMGAAPLALPTINFMSAPPLVNKIKHQYSPFGLDNKLDKYGLRDNLVKHLRTLKSSEAQIKELLDHWDSTVKGKINTAWRFVTEHAARSERCNNYFQSLPKQKTLKQILQEGHITIDCLVPKGKYTFEDVPRRTRMPKDLILVSIPTSSSFNPSAHSPAQASSNMTMWRNSPAL